MMKIVKLLLLSLVIASASCSDEVEPTTHYLAPEVHLIRFTVLSTSSAKFEAIVYSNLITSKGICWSKSPHPTILDNRTNQGPVPGNFTSIINELTPFTRYYIRAYAINKIDTAYDNFEVQIQTGYKIGEQYNGTIFYLDETNLHGLGCLALATDQLKAEWGCQGSEVSGADHFELGTGLQNTKDIVASCTNISIAAEKSQSLGLGAYLPSKEELNLAYINLHKTGVLNLGDLIYWSSTEHNADSAWVQDFSNGQQYPAPKKLVYTVLPIMKF